MLESINFLERSINSKVAMCGILIKFYVCAQYHFLVQLVA